LTSALGAVTDRYSYDAFGRLLASSGTTVNRYLFTGEQFDPLVNFYYLRARYYDLETGRFLSTDPLEGIRQAPSSLHRYVYSDNDPVNLVDPSGQQLEDVLLVVSIVDTLVASSGSGGSTPTKVKKLTEKALIIEEARRRLTEINPISIKANREYGGVIYRQGGRIDSTEPEPGDETGFKPGPILRGLPATADARAVYHTHGRTTPGYDNEHFSPGGELDDLGSALNTHEDYGTDYEFLATPKGKFWIAEYDADKNAFIPRLLGSIL
jgi:RHS repeat-associated protein